MQLNSIAEIKNHPEIKVWLIAENIRSAYNIGAMFRTADGTGMTGLILTGYSPTPENPKVMKTSLGAEKHVPWISVKQTTEVIEQLHEVNVKAYGLEIVRNAVSIYDFNQSVEQYPIAICAGNEVEGVISETMKALDGFLVIPMKGHKQSLNVAEASSITMYEFFRKLSS